MTALEAAIKRNVKALSSKCAAKDDRSCSAIGTGTLLVGVVVVAGVIWMWPEIRRYLRIERM